MNDSKLKNRAYIGIVLAVLILTNLALLIDSFMGYSSYVCEQLNAESYNLNAGSSLSQKIMLSHPFGKIGILFQKEGTFGGEDGVSVTMISDEQEYAYTILADKINNSEFVWIENPGISSEEFTIDITRMGNGDGTIQIILTDDTSLGTVDELSRGGKSLVLSVDVSYIKCYTSVRILSFLFSVILTVCIVLKYGNRETAPKWIVPATAVIIFLQLLCKYAWTILSGEPYYEISGLYFGPLFNDGISGFMMADTGYLPVFPHILCVILVLILRQTAYAPLFMSIISASIISCVIAFFVSERFKGWLNWQLRFLIVLVLGCTQMLIMQSQMILFLNFSYFGILLTAYIYMLDLECQDKKIIGWVILSGLMVASKGTFVVLMPLLLIVMLLCWKFKKRNTFIYTIWLEGCLLIQLLYVLFYPTGRSLLLSHDLVEICKQILKGFWCYIATIAKLLFTVNSATDSMVLFIFSCLLFIMVTAAGIKLVMKKDNKGLLLLGLECASIMQIILNQLGTGLSEAFVNESTIRSVQNLTYVPAYRYEKNILFTVIFLIIIFLVVTDTLYKSEVSVYKLSVILIVAFAIKGLFISVKEEYKEDTLGNWPGYNVVLDNSSYAIPLYTSNRFLTNNCFIVYVGVDSSVMDATVVKGAVGAEYKTITDVVLTDSLDLREYSGGNLLAVYGKKNWLFQTDKIYAVFKNNNDEVLCSIPAVVSDSENNAIGFLLDQPINNCCNIEFVNADGERISLQSQCWLAYEQNE